MISGKELSVNDVRSQGEGSLSSADIFRTKKIGGLQMRTSTFWCKNLRNFWKFMVVRTDKGVESWVSADMEGVSLSQFCADVCCGQSI